MIQESGDRRLADRHLFLRQPGLEFRQRNVRLLYHQFPDQSLMRHQRELLVAAKLGGADATCVAVNFEEAHHRADAHPTLLGGLGYGIATINRRDHAPTQVLRIRLRHPCWPPPSRKLESYSCRYGNPRFSLFGKRSKAPPDERGGNRYVQPTATAPHLDSTPSDRQRPRGNSREWDGPAALPPPTARR